MWKPILEFSGLYEVSDDGVVRSTSRIILDKQNHLYLHHGKLLKPNILKNGYLVVYLRKNSKTYSRYVHRLVAEAFIPNPKNLPTVNHLDGNKQNCKAGNLEWASYGMNNQHAYDIGLRGKGEHQYKAVLNESQVREIRANGKYSTYEAIARKYHVSRATIRDVLLNQTWKGIF